MEVMEPTYHFRIYGRRFVFCNRDTYEMTLGLKIMITLTDDDNYHGDLGDWWIVADNKRQ